jgi:hypothetical protein
MKAEPTPDRDMTNLTITVSKDVLRRARIRALQEDDSVNAYLRRCLDEYVDENDRRAEAIKKIQELWDAAELHWGSRTWSREELYER